MLYFTTPKLQDSAIVQQAANVVADLYITLAHVVILSGFRSITVSKTSGVGAMLSRMIIYTASRGILLTYVVMLHSTEVTHTSHM